MKYYPASFLIFRLICIVVIFQTNLTFAQNMNVYKTWIDDNGKHSLVIEKGITKNSTGEHLSVKQVTGRNIDWVLNDYVNDCEVDISLDVIAKSIEISRDFSNGETTVLFAYRIGCIGGLDPVTVKYFAYKNGVKYSLRGEEHIIVENGSYGGENPPIPDSNLRGDKPLLDYMLKKWGAISTTKVN
jgi:hypothetical protein